MYGPVVGSLGDFDEAIGFQRLEVTSAAAVGLTITEGAKKAFMVVETAEVRFSLHGVDATNVVGYIGQPLGVGQNLTLSNSRAMSKFSAIASSTTGYLSIHYFK